MESSKKSAAAGRLLKVLALRIRVARASPLFHVVVYLNVLQYIPSRYFGFSKQRHCTNESEFLLLKNSKSPLPHQRSWQIFLLSFTLSTKVIFELWTKTYLMGEWKRVRRIGKRFGGSGFPIVNLSELTHN